MPLLMEALEARTFFSTYFVSPTGSDAAVGSASKPWKTLQKAVDSVVAGDTVNVAKGDYAGFAKYGLKGTADKPIVFLAEPGVNIVSKAPAETALDVGIELSGYDPASGSAYVTLSGFNVNNASGTIKGSLSAGIRTRYSHDISIENCGVVSAGWVGVYAAYCSRLTISNCSSVGNNLFVDAGTARNHGIYIANSSSNVSIIGCTVGGNNGNGLHLNGDGGVNTGFTIEGNTIYGNGSLGGSAINGDGLQNSTIKNNLIVANKSKGIALYNIDATGESTGNLLDGNIVAQANGRDALQLTAAGNTVTGGAYVNLAGPAGAVASGNTIKNVLYRGAGIAHNNGNRVWVDGDCNFDGQVTADDYMAVDANLGSVSVLGIASGDNNFDNRVTADDYSAVDSNLGRRAA